MMGNEHAGGDVGPEATQTSPTILFDFGGVIVSNGYWDWVATVTTDEEERAKFTAIIDAADVGIITEEGLMQELSGLSNRPPELVSEQLSSSYVLNEGVADIIRELQEKGYPLALVTNFVSSRVSTLIDRYDLRQYFPRIFISSNMGLVKPSPEFFQRVTRELSITPTDAIFIDDSPRNIETALAENIQRSWLFTDAPSLKARFQDAQLLPPDAKPPQAI